MIFDVYNPAIQLKTGIVWVTSTSLAPGFTSGFTWHRKAEGECIIAKLTHSEYAAQLDFSGVQSKQFFGREILKPHEYPLKTP